MSDGLLASLLLLALVMGALALPVRFDPAMQLKEWVERRRK